MKHKLESRGAYLTPDTPDEVYERGDDGKLHLLDIDALLDKGDSGLLTTDEGPEDLDPNCIECIKRGDFAVISNGVAHTICNQCDLVKGAYA